MVWISQLVQQFLHVELLQRFFINQQQVLPSQLVNPDWWTAEPSRLPPSAAFGHFADDTFTRDFFFAISLQLLYL